VRIVPRAELVEMLDVAAALDMFVLLEAFDAEDLEVAASLAAERAGRDEQVLMGLNCRDLETLAIDFTRFDTLRAGLPPRWPAVAESGVQTTGDAALVASLGYRLALVGTSLMRRPDPELALRELVRVGREARR
jgi:indole-3-glycerol phosphate synthase